MKGKISFFAPSSFVSFIYSYCILARIHRPQAVWILLFPAWCGLVVASPFLPPLDLLGLFALGAFFMRSAGCVYNDIIDKNFDKDVKRTALRPLATGALSLQGAWACFMIFLAAAGGILLALPLRVMGVGCFTLCLVLLYPWMKRFTYWPQIFLGITFNMGVILGSLALSSTLTLPLLCLYGGAILWTVGYDTIYALQDLEDDMRIGIKSSPMMVLPFIKPFLTGVYSGTLFFWGLVGFLLCLKDIYWICWGAIAMHFLWQILTLKTIDPENCLRRFKANSFIGALLFTGLVFSRLIH